MEILVDESGTYQRSGHGLRLKFRASITLIDFIENLQRV